MSVVRRTCPLCVWVIYARDDADALAAELQHRIAKHQSK
jgi:hypothetical protein